MLKVGITGGIGSGKTTVCRIFEVLGIPVYYADERAKALMQTDLKLIAAIKDLFGDEAYAEGKLNRSFISSQVFTNKPLLSKLNAIVHPAVAHDVENWMDEHENYAYVLKEAALLFETGMNKQLDKVICVYSSSELRIARIKARDNATYDEVVARMKNQMSDEQKKELADYVIYNDPQHKLIPQVLAIHYILLDLEKKRG